MTDEETETIKRNNIILICFEHFWEPEIAHILVL